MPTIVADASVLVPALADPGPVGRSVRLRLAELADVVHVVQSLTELEVMSSMRKLVARGELDAHGAEDAIRRLPQLPAVPTADLRLSDDLTSSRR